MVNIFLVSHILLLFHSPKGSSQAAFPCSKLTIETLLDAIGVFMVSLLLTLNIFTPCFSISIVSFLYVGWLAGWVKISQQNMRNSESSAIMA